jgi:hypothetical protein
MEDELKPTSPELASNTESAALSTPASLPPRAETPPPANLYDDLKDGQIRLFELDITTGNIVGRLQTVETSSAPPFYALSYVCGKDACSEEITVNNRAVPVTPNLFTAVKELWLNFQGGHIAQLAIWIDAICIDQGNEEEKAEQVRKMHAAFSGAVEVLVWLGAADDNIRMVLRVFAWIESFLTEDELDPEASRQHESEPEYLESIGEPKLKAAHSPDLLSLCLEDLHRVSCPNLWAMVCFLAKLRPLFEDDSRPVSDESQKAAADERVYVAVNDPTRYPDLFPPDHVFWATLYTLMNLEWFGRTWTFQEIRLAQKARLLTQEVCVSWFLAQDCMRILLRALTYMGPRWPEAKIKRLPRLAERRGLALRWVQFMGPPHSHTTDVLLTLILTKNRVSTYARDNVYGLIALWESEVQAEIVIDYRRAAGEVFARAVKMGLKRNEQFTIADLWAEFDGPDRPRQAFATDRLPSWCPDFHHKNMNPPDDTPDRFLSPAVRNRVKALACYEHTSGFETISIRALKLDKIARTTKTACPEYSYSHEPFSVITEWLQELLEVRPSEDRLDRSSWFELRSFFYETRRIFRNSPGFTFDRFSDSLALLAFARPGQLEDVVDPFQKPTLAILTCRSGLFFFVTDSGRVGYSARQPCVGDHIVLVPGTAPTCPLHMLTADCSRYVGCANVFGLMGESLLDILDDMETKWEMVCLR